MRTADRVIECLNRNGWCPALWGHHPPEIREAIREMGFRPAVKGCFANCQRFVLANAMLGLGLDVEYREGWVLGIIPFEHAWLVYRPEGGEEQILDLTLDPDTTGEYEYQDSTGYSVDAVHANCVRTGMYKPVDQRRLLETSPFGNLAAFAATG